MWWNEGLPTPNDFVVETASHTSSGSQQRSGFIESIQQALAGPDFRDPPCHQTAHAQASPQTVSPSFRSSGLLHRHNITYKKMQLKTADHEYYQEK